MEVLKPELLWIGGRCYRVNKSSDMDDDPPVSKSNAYVEEGKLITKILNGHLGCQHSRIPNNFYLEWFSRSLRR